MTQAQRAKLIFRIGCDICERFGSAVELTAITENPTVLAPPILEHLDH